MVTALLLVCSNLQAQDEPPPGLAEVESARSRACVASLAQLAELEAELDPYARRLDRLNALGRAVSLEKAGDVTPLDPEDPVEAAVAEWFAADSALAMRYISQSDSTILQERSAARDAILTRLRQEIQTTAEEGQTRAAEGATVQQAAQPCVGAILVRDVVLEECATTSSPVCEAARSEEPHPVYKFVEEPEGLWSIEGYGPWSRPGPIQLDVTGSLTGARTGARASRGNIRFNVALAPLIRARSDLDEEAIQDFEANLDSLGFSFEHPLLVMAPGIQIQGSLPAPIGGETLYVLHFGDLSGDDVIWSMDAGSGGLFQAFFPAMPRDLARLRAGEMVSLTAVRVPEGTGGEVDAEAVYSLSLLQVGQAENVGSLLDYISGGALERDLLRLVPPGST
jgi:hypothetical protein